MPTPFYHLKSAEDFLSSHYLPKPLQLFLTEQRAAFLFGNVAPDVQVISGQARSSTHFFELPIRRNEHPPWEIIETRYPELSECLNQKNAKAAFLAGYLCHLQADWMWVSDIFLPIFGLKSQWSTFSHRQYIHNVLRAYLDKELSPKISRESVFHLGQASPLDWLPFIIDERLCEWRDYLVNQLCPGGQIQTVEVFADRQGIAPDKYYQALESEELMDREVFSHIDRQSLSYYYQQLILKNQELIKCRFENIHCPIMIGA